MTPEDTTDLRRTILRTLYLRRSAALTASFIATRASRELGLEITPAQIGEEMNFLRDAGFVQSLWDPLGSLQQHTLTSEGVLFCERNAIA